MKFLALLSFPALAAAIMIPEGEMMQQFATSNVRQDIDQSKNTPQVVDDIVSDLEKGFSKLVDTTKDAFDSAIEQATSAGEEVAAKCHNSASGARVWIENAASKVEDLGKHHGHHGHHHKPNLTVYQIIAKSKYTTKLAALIDEYDDVVKLLNSTEANFTVFAPIDSAFEKVPEGAPKPSKEELKSILLYHVSSDFYPAGRVLVTHTVPTLYTSDGIGGNKQRLSTNIGLKGLTVNFYSRIIAIDVFGTNGVIHGVDSLLIPPPKAATVIELLPSEFSTLELGLVKTGLFEGLNDTSTHIGGTVFAPSNFAFQKLGPKINAFLFSTYGLKYLKALLEYHIVPNKTLYSDAYLEPEDSKNVEQLGIPKGYFHVRLAPLLTQYRILTLSFQVDLPTMLKDRALSVDVARYGRIIIIKINAFTTITIEDGIVYDGVIHIPGDVLVPPKPVTLEQWNGEEMTVDEFKSRLEPFVEGSDNEDKPSFEL